MTTLKKGDTAPPPCRTRPHNMYKTTGNTCIHYCVLLSSSFLASASVDCPGRGHPGPSNVTVIIAVPASSLSSSSHHRAHHGRLWPSLSPSVVVGHGHISWPSPTSQRQAYPHPPIVQPSLVSQRRAHHCPPRVVAGRAHPRLPTPW